ncbi:MAG: electron transport complex subunit RsxG [gamma proteobacterium symbiont of Taylorina sp.]|nr:electron transport complex subunit RsxG [gamma proteobacterium symbiont of Taylorina sp.]
MIKKILKNMLFSASLLAGFGGIGTALVVFTFESTKEKIDANEKAILLKNLNYIIPPESHSNNLLDNQLIVPADSLLNNKSSKNSKGITLYQAWQEKQPVAVAFPIVANDGYNGEIKLLIAILSSGTISGVRVIAHKETPGLGDKIEVEKSDWILGFNHKTLDNPGIKQWKVKKDGGVFDQFSGATITPRAVVNAIYKALDYFNQNRDKLFLDQEIYDQLLTSKKAGAK